MNSFPTKRQIGFITSLLLFRLSPVNGVFDTEDDGTDSVMTSASQFFGQRMWLTFFFFFLITCDFSSVRYSYWREHFATQFAQLCRSILIFCRALFVIENDPRQWRQHKWLKWCFFFSFPSTFSAVQVQQEKEKESNKSDKYAASETFSKIRFEFYFFFSFPFVCFFVLRRLRLRVFVTWKSAFNTIKTSKKLFPVFVISTKFGEIDKKSKKKKETNENGNEIETLIKLQFYIFALHVEISSPNHQHKNRCFILSP